jgi:hypothetical protein
MRNDARPIGEHAPASPVGGSDRPGESTRAQAADEAPIPSERPDSRDTVGHGRESHIVNRPAERREPSDPDDPVMPQSDSTLNTKI